MNSLFSALPSSSADPIFALVEAYQNDKNPHRVGLSIGTYFDEDGHLPAMPPCRWRKPSFAGPMPPILICLSLVWRSTGTRARP